MSLREVDLLKTWVSVVLSLTLILIPTRGQCLLQDPRELVHRCGGKPPLTMKSFEKLVDAGRVQEPELILLLSITPVARLKRVRSRIIPACWRQIAMPPVRSLGKCQLHTSLCLAVAVGEPPAPAPDPAAQLPGSAPQVGEECVSEWCK